MGGKDNSMKGKIRLTEGTQNAFVIVSHLTVPSASRLSAGYSTDFLHLRRSVKA